MSPSQHGTTDNLPRKPAPGPSIRTNLESFCPDHARSRPSPGGPPKLSCSTMRSHGTFGAVSPLEPAELLAAYDAQLRTRSEEHTSELQSLMRISYAVFCLKKKQNHT